MYRLTVVASIFAIGVVLLTALLRHKVVVISFQHYRWVGLIFTLSFLGFIIFLFSEVTELALPIGELEDILTTIILSVLTVRGAATLALLAKHRNG